MAAGLRYLPKVMQLLNPNKISLNNRLTTGDCFVSGEIKTMYSELRTPNSQMKELGVLSPYLYELPNERVRGTVPLSTELSGKRVKDTVPLSSKEAS